MRSVSLMMFWSNDMVFIWAGKGLAEKPTLEAIQKI